MTKYKIHDITSDKYFPKSKEIFIPTADALLEQATYLCVDKPYAFSKEALEILVYEDRAFFEEPKEIVFLSDFVIKL